MSDRPAFSVCFGRAMLDMDALAYVGFTHVCIEYDVGRRILQQIGLTSIYKLQLFGNEGEKPRENLGLVLVRPKFRFPKYGSKTERIFELASPDFLKLKYTLWWQYESHRSICPS